MSTPLHDGIILAAGKNTRLAGLVPSYYKPMVLVNGEPLIVTTTRALLQRCQNIAIVVSPENAAPIADLLNASGLLGEGSRINFVVQPFAAGPGDALDRGLCAVRNERVLVALGDNVTPINDYDVVLQALNSDAEPDTVISTSWIKDEERAARFTRIDDDGRAFEGVPGGYSATHQGFRCWVGPFSASASQLRRCLNDLRLATELKELKISPLFNMLPGRLVTVIGSSIDIGTSEALFSHIIGDS